jgi:hypothetical protein
MNVALVYGSGKLGCQKYIFMRSSSNPQRQLVTPINMGILSREQEQSMSSPIDKKK